MSQAKTNSLEITGFKKVLKVKYLVPLSVFFAIILLKYSIFEVVLSLLCYLFGYLLFYFLFQYKHQVFKLLLKLIPLKFENAIRAIICRKPSLAECNICRVPECLRYSENNHHEPWNNLFIHKQLDQAIENFYKAILNTFVTSWYSTLTDEDTLIFELRFLLRHASSSLLNRALKVDVGEIILKKLVPCVLRHYSICKEAQKIKEIKGLPNLEDAALEGPLKYCLHSALSSRERELEYLRCITEEIMPKLLPKQECDSKLFSTLIREIFAGWVLLSITDLLADPNIINTLIILATSEEKMAQLPELPNHEVQFLENFIENKSYKRMRLLTVEVSEILKSPEYLYSFMQFMKSVGKIHLLQFCLDLDEFNKKMICPEINHAERVALFKRASELYSIYFSHESSSFISFKGEYIKQFKKILDEGVENIVQLQRSAVIYEAYDYVFSLLDQEWAPKFFDSSEFYKLIMPHIITEPKKFLTNTKFDKSNSSVIGKPLSKFKEAFKTQAIDGQVIDINDSYMKTGDSDSVENMELESQFYDVLSNYTRLKQKDTTFWRVSIEETVERKSKHKNGMVDWFLININKIDPHGLGNDSQWMVERNDQDFYVLKEKLIEFHGENLFNDIQIPSKKVKAAAEIRKKKYEVFLQNLLTMSVLKSSDLLHLFLTVDADFTKKASLDSSSLPDIGNMYQNVTHKLRKEKGQHLDPFLQTYMISADVDYYQSINEDKKYGEEEGTDAMKDETLTSNKKIARSLINGVFENNFNLKPDSDSNLAVGSDFKFKWSISECALYILNDVFHARQCFVNIYGYICQLTNVDNYLIMYLNKILREVLSPPRLGHLIKLGEDVIFNDSVPASINMDRNVKFKLARSQLQEAFPFLITKVISPNFLTDVDTLFEFLQNPILNKQLVYTLLDAIIVELFPELQDKS